MKEKLLAGLLVTGLFVYGIVGIANAVPILQTDFSSSAIVYDFSGATIGQATVTSGILTVTNGVVYNLTIDGGMNSPTYYDGGDSSVIRSDFLNAVSAVGMSIYSNKQNITLSVYDNTDTQLETYTIDWTTLPTTTDGFPYGFIGIDYGLSSIAYALVDTPLTGYELFIDNITYQSSAPVPEPSTILLVGTGLLGIVAFGRKRLNKKA